MHFLWSLLVLWCLVAAARSTEIVLWNCTGSESDLTYEECSQIGPEGIGRGCYYLEDFAQYRPCYGVCSKTRIHSIDEERCNSHCEGFLERNCVLSNHTTTTETAATTTSQINGFDVTESMSSIKASSHKRRNLWWIAIPCIGTLAAIVIVICVLLNYRKRTPVAKLIKEEEGYDDINHPFNENIQAVQPEWNAAEEEKQVDVNM